MKFEKAGSLNIWRAFKNSLRGLKALWQNEKPFRLEVTISIILLSVIFLLPISGLLKLLMVLMLVLVMLVEALNSAIETVVDRISLDIHEKSGLAKDLGSAAVAISIGMNILVWIYAMVLTTSYFLHHLRNLAYANF